MRSVILTVITIVAMAICTWAQSGGTFTITKSVTAGGGGQSSGGTFVVDGTIGQALAGTTSGGGTFTVESGFWTSAPNSLAGTITYGNVLSGQPRFISNVLLTATGAPNVSTSSTFPGGTYFLSGFGAGAYTVTPTKTGGINGITSFDAALIALHVAGPPNPTLNANQLTIADVSGNGIVSSFDAGMIAKYVAGPPFIAPGIGSTSTWRFTPNNRPYASITGNLAGEDYVGRLMGEVSGNWNNTNSRPDNTGGPPRAITVKLPNIQTSAEKEIVVPINVEGVTDQGIVSYEFNLTYDPAVLQPVGDSIDLDGTVSRGLLAVANSVLPGVIRVVVYGPKQIDSNGVLLNVKFRTVGEKGSSSPLMVDRIMFNEGNSSVNVTSGRVELN